MSLASSTGTECRQNHEDPFRRPKSSVDVNFFQKKQAHWWVSAAL